MTLAATPPPLTYTDHHADLTFTWDGWMQIRIKNGPSVPWSAWPDRFDIREPDLRRDDLKTLFPQHPDDPSVHFIPVTQTDLTDTCTTWMHGRHIGAGRRDYATFPWHGSTYGWISGALDGRYLGGDSIEASPRGTDNWRPIIDLAADGFLPELVSTSWLQDRLNGWILAFLTRHGIDTTRDDIFDATFEWTRTHLPTGCKATSTAAAWSTWVERKTAALWESSDIEEYRNAGGTWHPIGTRPWYTRRTATDGSRWNFLWTGAPYAYVYSPDVPAQPRLRLLAYRPNEGRGYSGSDAVRTHLTRLADKWMSGPAINPCARTAWSTDVYNKSRVHR